MNKNRQIISELKDFFKHNDSSKATYAGMDVQLFFYKKGNGSWNALITTDMGIDAKRTFELYARRWCIEVAHKEMKGLLN